MQDLPRPVRSILFVCLGNICRSPTAEAVFRQKAKAAGLDIRIRSAGTSAAHIGEPPDRRSRAAGEARGYDFTGQTSQRLQSSDFEDFDLILGMDNSNLRDMQRRAVIGVRAKLGLLGDFAPEPFGREVPDPYYGGSGGFDDVLDMVEAACENLITALSVE